MKKSVNQIVMVLGFIVLLVGTIIANLSSYAVCLATFGTVNLAAIFAVTCIFADNRVIKNIGYSLSSFVAAYGIGVIATQTISAIGIGGLVASIGMIIMGLAVVLYALIFVLKVFGFVKSGEKTECASTATLDELGRYKEMLQDKILSEDEFDSLKQKILANAEAKAISIDDLKKWKKLLDQQIINESEFKQIKDNIFNK